MSLPALPDVFGNYALRGFEEVLPPDPVSWLPVTLGWRVVFAIILIRLSWAGYKRGKKWWHDRYRRTALQTLGGIFSADSIPRARLQSLAELLKATALYAYPRAEIAALTGAAWIDWLNQHTQTPMFNEASGTLLTTTLYQSDNNISDTELRELKAAAANWIRQHPGANDA